MHNRTSARRTVQIIAKFYLSCSVAQRYRSNFTHIKLVTLISLIPYDIKNKVYLLEPPSNLTLSQIVDRRHFDFLTVATSDNGPR